MTARCIRIRTAQQIKAANSRRAARSVTPVDRSVMAPTGTYPVFVPSRSAVKPVPSLWAGTLGDYLMYWLRTYKKGTVKQTSYDTLERVILSYILPGLGDISLQKLTPDALQGLLSGLMEQGYSYSTICKTYHCLGASLRMAYLRKLIPENPMELVTLPAKALFPCEDDTIEFFDPRECSRIIEEAGRAYNTGRPVYVYGDAIIVLLLTGLRLGELIGLRRDDYDPEKRIISVRRNVTKARKRDENGELLPGRTLAISTTKSYSGRRDIPLTRQAQAAIERMLADNICSEHIVCNSKGEMATPEQIDRTFHRLLVNAGLKPCGVHKLRHTFASLLFGSRKVDIKTISQLLGHASPVITLNIYTHVSREIPYEAVTPLDELF